MAASLQLPEFCTLQAAQAAMRQCGLPPEDVRALLTALTGRSVAWLRANDLEPLKPDQAHQLRLWVDQRLDQVPVAYLTGRKAFHGIELSIDRRVLDPRPDTEVLVDWGLDILEHLRAQRQQSSSSPVLEVADLGCGSGAVGLSVLTEAQRRGWNLHLVASDLSEDALAVAQANAQSLGASVHWRSGSWWEARASDERPWPVLDLVLSNPPYLAQDDPHLKDLRHEPQLALCSGKDGLDAIRDILRHAAQKMSPGAWLLFEHGHEQALPVRTLLEQSGFVQVQSRQDLAGIERCSGGQIPTRG